MRRSSRRIIMTDNSESTRGSYSVDVDYDEQQIGGGGTEWIIRRLTLRAMECQRIWRRRWRSKRKRYRGRWRINCNRRGGKMTIQLGFLAGKSFGICEEVGLDGRSSHWFHPGSSWSVWLLHGSTKEWIPGGAEGGVWESWMRMNTLDSVTFWHTKKMVLPFCISYNHHLRIQIRGERKVIGSQVVEKLSTPKKRRRRFKGPKGID